MSILIAILSYLIGSIPFSFLIAKLYKKNLYQEGTQNIGTANVWRATGKPEAALLAFLADAGKGFFAIFLTQILGKENLELNQTLAIFFVVLGHNWPIFLNFKGGRGLATLAGIIFYLNWKILFLTLLILGASIVMTELITKNKFELSGKPKEKIRKAAYVFTSQVLGRIIGIILSLFFVLIFWPKIFKIVLPAMFLVVVKHFKRLINFLKKREN